MWGSENEVINKVIETMWGCSQFLESVNGKQGIFRIKACVLALNRIMGKAIWKRFIRFLASDGEVHYGEPTTNDDIGKLYHKLERIHAREIIGDVFGECSFGRTLVVVKLLSPLSSHETGPPRGLGTNYPIGGMKKPPLPILFYKPLSSISGPEDTIVVPKSVQNNQTDYEAELVIVIGKKAKNVSIENAMEYVGGYTLTNDLTARKNQFATSQWGMGKSFDGWLPIGPVVVSSSVINDPQTIQLKTILNGATMQDGSTSEQLYKVAETVAHLSTGCTLEPGTIIATGTPDGQGSGRKPQVWLRNGDEIRIWGSHGLGTLTNYIIYETTGSLISKL